MKVLVIGTDECTRNYYITLAIFDAFKRNKHIEKAFLARSDNAVSVALTNSCDLLVAVGGAAHQDALLSILCSVCPVSVLWCTEDPYEGGENALRSKLFTHVFTNDESSLDFYEGRAGHLPLAASRLFHDRPVREDKDCLYDIFFAGTAWPNRTASLNKILHPFRGTLRTKIALPTNEFLPPVSVPLADQDLDWRCSSEDFSKLANLSRITLTLGRSFTTSNVGRASGVTPPPRIFETALSGSYQIFLTDTLASDNYFDGYNEVVTCDTEDAAIAKIAQALSSPDDRIKVAQAARDRVLNEHLYDHRVESILKRVRESSTPTVTAKVGRGDRNILIVTHNLAGFARGGGVEVYQDYIQALPPPYNVFFLMPRSQDGLTTFVVRRPDLSFVEFSLDHLIHSRALTDDAAEKAFSRIIFEFKISLIHFQHLLGFPISLPLIASAHGVPVVFTLHDYYLICERFNLLAYDGRYCDIASKSQTHCDICLNAASGVVAGSQQRRRNFIEKVMMSFSVIIVNTPFSGNYLRRIYPGLPAEKIVTIEMLAPSLSYSPTEAVDKQKDGVLRVVIPGNFTEGKGADQIIRILNATRIDKIHYIIAGFVEPRYNEILRSLVLEHVTVRGGYRPADSSSIMADCDVSLHLSIWPETFMITLSEAWQASVVPIVSSLGAPGERVTNGVDGFVVDPLDIGAVIDLLRVLQLDQNMLRAMKENITTKKPSSVELHLRRLAQLYNQLLERPPIAYPEKLCSSDILNWVSGRAIGMRVNAPTWDSSQLILDPVKHIVEETEPQNWISFDLPHDLIGKKPFVNVERLIVGNYINIDICDIDGIDCIHAKRPVLRKLTISGWAYINGQGGLRKVYLRFRGRGGTVAVCRAHQIDRPDVAAHLNEADARSSGFKLSLQHTNLSPELYSIDIIHEYDRNIQIFSDILEIEFDNTKVTRNDAILSLANLSLEQPDASRPA